MKLFFWDDPTFPPNFGDQLNLWLWPQLLPGVFDGDPAEIFVGIGSILNTRIPDAERIIVMGSGVGYGTLPTPNENWTIYAVRGPETASALNLAAETAVVDPGVLVRRIFADVQFAKSGRVAFMPHWRSRSGDWPSLCKRIGIDYIDPLSRVPDIIAAVRGAKFLVAEALHGAITADAFRVPWVSLWSEDNVDGFQLKWKDWCSSVRLEYCPQVLPESLARAPDPRWKRIARRVWRAVYPRPRKRQIERVAGYMNQIVSDASPILSDEDVLDDRVRTLLHRIERFRMNHTRTDTV